MGEAANGNYDLRLQSDKYQGKQNKDSPSGDHLCGVYFCASPDFSESSKVHQCDKTISHNVGDKQCRPIAVLEHYQKRPLVKF